MDAKQIKLKDKNILDYIKDAIPTIKHSQDTRETVTENDLWGQWVETLEDGTVIVHDDEIVNPNGSSSGWNKSITKVENNKDGEYMFFQSNLTTFTSDLSSLTYGYKMFQSCAFRDFHITLASLIDGHGMFNKTKLSPQSVMYIAGSIKDIVAEKQLYIDGTIPYVTLVTTSTPYNTYSALKGFMSDGSYAYTYTDGTYPDSNNLP